MSTVEKRHGSGRRGSGPRASDALSDSSSAGSLMDDTDREVSSLTDRAFRSLCIGDEAVYSDADLGSSPCGRHHAFAQEAAAHTDALKQAANETLRLSAVGGWGVEATGTFHGLLAESLVAQQQQVQQLSYLSNGSTEVAWQQRRSTSRVSSLIKAFGGGGGEACYDPVTPDAMATRDGGELWDRLSAFSAVPDPAGSGSFLRASRLRPPAPGPANLFLHSQFSPFQAWSEYQRPLPRPPPGPAPGPAPPPADLPRWYDSPLYKELTCGAPAALRSQGQEGRRSQRRPAEERSEPELAANGAPWKRSGPPRRPPTVSPSGDSAFLSAAAGAGNFAPLPSNATPLPSNATPLPSSAATPFSISQLLTPVLPPRQGTDASEVLQLGLAGGAEPAEGRAEPAEQQRHLVEVRQLRDGYKARASSLLFNLKDNRKRVKSTYSPTRFRSSSRQPEPRPHTADITAPPTLLLYAETPAHNAETPAPSVPHAHNAETPAPSVCHTHNAETPAPSVCHAHNAETPAPSLPHAHNAETPAPSVCHAHNAETPAPSVPHAHNAETPAPSVPHAHNAETPAPSVPHAHNAETPAPSVCHAHNAETPAPSVCHAHNAETPAPYHPLDSEAETSAPQKPPPPSAALLPQCPPASSGELPPATGSKGGSNPILPPHSVAPAPHKGFVDTNGSCDYLALALGGGVGWHGNLVSGDAQQGDTHTRTHPAPGTQTHTHTHAHTRTHAAAAGPVQHSPVSSLTRTMPGPAPGHAHITSCANHHRDAPAPAPSPAHLTSCANHHWDVPAPGPSPAPAHLTSCANHHRDAPGPAPGPGPAPYAWSQQHPGWPVDGRGYRGPGSHTALMDEDTHTHAHTLPILHTHAHTPTHTHSQALAHAQERSLDSERNTAVLMEPPQANTQHTPQAFHYNHTHATHTHGPYQYNAPHTQLTHHSYHYVPAHTPHAEETHACTHTGHTRMDAHGFDLSHTHPTHDVTGGGHVYAPYTLYTLADTHTITDGHSVYAPHTQHTHLSADTHTQHTHLSADTHHFNTAYTQHTHEQAHVPVDTHHYSPTHTRHTHTHTYVPVDTHHYSPTHTRHTHTHTYVPVDTHHYSPTHTRHTHTDTYVPMDTHHYSPTHTRHTHMEAMTSACEQPITDAVVRAENELPQTTDTYGTQRCETVSQTTDTYGTQRGETVSKTTDTYGNQRGETVSKTTDTYGNQRGETVSKTTDTYGNQRGETVSKTTDTYGNQRGETVSKTTDTYGNQSGETVSKTTDTYGIQRGETGETVSKTTDMYGIPSSETGETVSKTTDTYGNQSGETVCKTTDTYGNQRGETVSKTTDTYGNQRGETVSKTTDTYGNQRGETVSKTPDTYGNQSGETVSKTTDTYGNQRGETVSKTTDTYGNQSGETVSKTTDTYGIQRDETGETVSKPTDMNGIQRGQTALCPQTDTEPAYCKDVEWLPHMSWTYRQTLESTRAEREETGKDPEAQGTEDTPLTRGTVAGAPSHTLETDVKTQEKRSSHKSRSSSGLELSNTWSENHSATWSQDCSTGPQLPQTANKQLNKNNQPEDSNHLNVHHPPKDSNHLKVHHPPKDSNHLKVHHPPKDSDQVNVHNQPKDSDQLNVHHPPKNTDQLNVHHQPKDSDLLNVHNQPKDSDLLNVHNQPKDSDQLNVHHPPKDSDQLNVHKQPKNTDQLNVHHQPKDSDLLNVHNQPKDSDLLNVHNQPKDSDLLNVHNQPKDSDLLNVHNQPKDSDLLNVHNQPKDSDLLNVHNQPKDSNSHLTLKKQPTNNAHMTNDLQSANHKSLVYTTGVMSHQPTATNPPNHQLKDQQHTNNTDSAINNPPTSAIPVATKLPGNSIQTPDRRSPDCSTGIVPTATELHQPAHSQAVKYSQALVNEQPTVNQQLVSSHTSLNNQATVAKQPAVSNHTAVNNQTTVTNQKTANQQAEKLQPVVAKKPIANNTQAVNKHPVVIRQPTINNQQDVNSQPTTANNQPLVKNQQPVSDNPTVNSQHTVNKPQAVSSEQHTQKPVSSPQPIDTKVDPHTTNQIQANAALTTNQNPHLNTTLLSTQLNPQLLPASQKLPNPPLTTDQNQQLNPPLPTTPYQQLKPTLTANQNQHSKPNFTANQNQPPNSQFPSYQTNPTNQNPLPAQEPVAGDVDEAGQSLSRPIREERFSISDILSIRDKELMRRERLKEIRQGLGDVTQSANQEGPGHGKTPNRKDSVYITKENGIAVTNPDTGATLTAGKKFTANEGLPQKENETLINPESKDRSDRSEQTLSKDRSEQSLHSRRDPEKSPGKPLTQKEKAQSKQEMLTSKVKAHAQKEISALKEKGFLSRNTPKPLPTAVREKGPEQHSQVKKEITAEKLNHLFKDLTKYGEPKEPDLETLWQIPLPEVHVVESSALTNATCPALSVHVGTDVTCPGNAPVLLGAEPGKIPPTLKDRDAAKPQPVFEPKPQAVRGLDGESRPTVCLQHNHVTEERILPAQTLVEAAQAGVCSLAAHQEQKESNMADQMSANERASVGKQQLAQKEVRSTDNMAALTLGPGLPCPQKDNAGHSQSHGGKDTAPEEMGQMKEGLSHALRQKEIVHSGAGETKESPKSDVSGSHGEHVQEQDLSNKMHSDPKLGAAGDKTNAAKNAKEATLSPAGARNNRDQQLNDTGVSDQRFHTTNHKDTGNNTSQTETPGITKSMPLPAQSKGDAIQAPPLAPQNHHVKVPQKGQQKVTGLTSNQMQQNESDVQFPPAPAFPLPPKAPPPGEHKAPEMSSESHDTRAFPSSGGITKGDITDSVKVTEGPDNTTANTEEPSVMAAEGEEAPGAQGAGFFLEIQSIIGYVKPPGTWADPCTEERGEEVQQDLTASTKTEGNASSMEKLKKEREKLEQQKEHKQEQQKEQQEEHRKEQQKEQQEEQQGEEQGEQRQDHLREQQVHEKVHKPKVGKISGADEQTGRGDARRAPMEAGGTQEEDGRVPAVEKTLPGPKARSPVAAPETTHPDEQTGRGDARRAPMKAGGAQEEDGRGFMRKQEAAEEAPRHSEKAVGNNNDKSQLNMDGSGAKAKAMREVTVPPRGDSVLRTHSEERGESTALRAGEGGGGTRNTETHTRVPTDLSYTLAQHTLPTGPSHQGTGVTQHPLPTGPSHQGTGVTQHTLPTGPRHQGTAIRAEAGERKQKTAEDSGELREKTQTTGSSEAKPTPDLREKTQITTGSSEAKPTPDFREKTQTTDTPTSKPTTESGNRIQVTTKDASQSECAVDIKCKLSAPIADLRNETQKKSVSKLTAGLTQTTRADSSMFKPSADLRGETQTRGEGPSSGTTTAVKDVTQKTEAPGSQPTIAVLKDITQEISADVPGPQPTAKSHATRDCKPAQMAVAPVEQPSNESSRGGVVNDLHAGINFHPNTKATNMASKNGRSQQVEEEGRSQQVQTKGKSQQVEPEVSGSPPQVPQRRPMERKEENKHVKSAGGDVNASNKGRTLLGSPHKDRLDARVDARVHARVDARKSASPQPGGHPSHQATVGGASHTQPTAETPPEVQRSGRERGEVMEKIKGRKERGLSTERERGWREREETLERERGGRERGLSIERERGRRERGLSIDRERGGRERGLSIERERGRGEFRPGDRERAAEKDPRSGATTEKRRDEREVGRGHPELWSGERGGGSGEERTSGLRQTMTSGRDTRGAPKTTSTAEDSNSHNAQLSTAQSVKAPTHPAVGAPRQGSKDIGPAWDGSPGPLHQRTPQPASSDTLGILGPNSAMTAEGTKDKAPTPAGSTFGLSAMHPAPKARSPVPAVEKTLPGPKARSPVAALKTTHPGPKARSPVPAVEKTLPGPKARSPVAAPETTHPAPKARSPVAAVEKTLPGPKARSPVAAPETTHPGPKARSPVAAPETTHPGPKARSPVAAPETTHPGPKARSPVPAVEKTLPGPKARSPVAAPETTHPGPKARSPVPAVETTHPGPKARSPVPAVEKTLPGPKDNQPPAEATRGRVPVAGGPEKEQPNTAERRRARPASRPEISALADYARLRVLPERDNDITADDTLFPVAVTHLDKHTAVSAETRAELSLEADRAKRDADATMARVLRYREREKHAASRVEPPASRRENRAERSHAAPAAALAARDHRKPGATPSQQRERIKEDKLSWEELQQHGTQWGQQHNQLIALAQPSEVKGRRRGTSLPREAIRDRSTEREFYHQPVAAFQRGRPGIPKRGPQSPGEGAEDRGHEGRVEPEPEPEPEPETEPLQYYSVSSLDPDPKPANRPETHPHEPPTAPKHTLQPGHDPLTASKHAQQSAMPKRTPQPIQELPAGPKHATRYVGRESGLPAPSSNENGFTQAYPSTMKDQNGFTQDAAQVFERGERSFTQNALPAPGRGEGVLTQPLVDHGRSQVIVAPRSNPSSPAFGRPTMFNVKDNTFRVASVTKAVKPRFHRSVSENFRVGSPRQGGVERMEDLLDPATDPQMTPSHTPHTDPALQDLAATTALHRFSRARDILSHNALPPAESPAPRESSGRFRRSLAPDEDETRSLVSALSEDVDLSELERPESACSLSSERSQSGRPPPTVPPKSEKALRRAKRLTSRRLKKAEAKAVASVPSSPTHVLSAPLQLPHAAPAQYHLNAGFTPTATGVVSPPYPVAQRRILQDPNSGQYFMVDVPLPVKTKMFFDPQTGKYVHLSVRQPPEGALSPPRYMVYPGYVPVPVSSLPTARSSSQMSAPATLTQERDALEASGAPWGPEEGPQRQGRGRHGYRRQEQPEDTPLYKEQPQNSSHRHMNIITMSELEDFAMESV